MLISLQLQGRHETKQKTPVDQCWWLHHDADGEDEGDGPKFLLVACLGKKYLKVISATTNKLQSDSKLAAALEKYTSSASCMDVSKNGRHVAVAGIRRKGGFVVTWNSTAGLVKVHDDAQRTTPGGLSFGTDSGRAPRHVFIADDGKTMLLVTYLYQVFMWHRSTHDAWYALPPLVGNASDPAVTISGCFTAAHPLYGNRYPVWHPQYHVWHP